MPVDTSDRPSPSSATVASITVSFVRRRLEPTRAKGAGGAGGGTARPNHGTAVEALVGGATPTGSTASSTSTQPGLYTATAPEAVSTAAVLAAEVA